MIGRQIKIFYEKKVLLNRPPLNVQEQDCALFDAHKELGVPQSALFLLKNVYVTDLGIIYKNLFSVKENIVCYHIDFKKYRFRYLLKSLLRFKKLRYSGKKAVIVFDNYSGPNGFAHWICDGLTRLVELNETLVDYTLIVPNYFKEQAVYRETLALFDISEIHYLQKDSVTFFKELYFPSAIADTGNFHPENILKLKNLFKSKINLGEPAVKLIYISRQKAKRRFVENENEVIQLLTNLGFETVFMEEYSFVEQIKIIHGAAAIVSIHGAALAMLIFANEGVPVMELRSADDLINNMYFLLANANKQPYYYLNCKSVERSKTANNFDIQVDLELLEKNVKNMISEIQLPN